MKIVYSLRRGIVVLLLIALGLAMTPSATRAAAIIRPEWGGSVETSPTTSNLNGVTCVSTAFCIAVGANKTLLQWNGALWSSQDPAFNQAVNAVSCFTTTMCMAVGNGGSSSLWNGTTWTVKNTGVGNPITAVSCASATFCLAGTSSKDILSWNGTAWSTITTNVGAAVQGLSCVTPTSCFIVGANGLIRFFNGTTISIPTISFAGTPQISAVTCVATTFCIAVGANGQIFKWDGTVWSSVTTLVAVLKSVSCTSTTACVAVGDAGTVQRWNGTTWAEDTSGKSAAGTTNMTGISCVAQYNCYAVGEGGKQITAIPLTLNDVSANFDLDMTVISCLTAMDVTENAISHPNATPSLRTGRYWQINHTPTGSCTTTYKGDLTLPYASADANDTVCRYTGISVSWDCKRTDSVANTSVRRRNITQFSPWAVGDNAGPTAVTLNSFTGERSQNGTFLRWNTASEADISGFQIWRSSTGRRADAVLLTSELIPATGDLVSGSIYSFTDTTALRNGYTYWLRGIHRDNSATDYSVLALAPRQATPMVYLPLVQR